MTTHAHETIYLHKLTTQCTGAHQEQPQVGDPLHKGATKHLDLGGKVGRTDVSVTETNASVCVCECVRV